MAARSDSPSLGALRKRRARARRKAGLACVPAEVGGAQLNMLIRHGFLSDALHHSTAEVSAAVSAYLKAQAEREE